MSPGHQGHHVDSSERTITRVASPASNVVSTVGSHILNIGAVSYTSNIPQNEMEVSKCQGPKLDPIHYDPHDKGSPQRALIFGTPPWW